VRISILGSGSGGNCTLIASGRTRLLLDAGFSRRETLRRLKAVGAGAERIDAILITHEHTDHVAGLGALASAFDCPVYITALTRDALSLENDKLPRFELFQAGRRFLVGDIEVEPFTVPHDALDTVAFRLTVEGMRVAVCTDLGYLPDSVKVHLAGCDFLAIESDYDPDMLKVGPYPWSVKQRVLSRTGHLSNTALSDFLLNDFDRKAHTLVLVHLSENNNHPEIARLSAAMALEARGAAGTRLVVSSQAVPTELFEF
jgi:phosphoribosyl 1,2-cyclic phosphodiesterase